ncbi:MAG: ribosome maturation factor RimP [Alphaproteobacteria bacterium]|nr:MAG: ribosome maturation factor RimP [Alphaproteobacteria bacterium]
MIAVAITPVEDKVLQALLPSFGTLGYTIVRVQVRGTERITLEILIERVDGEPVALSDCVQASHQASAILDVEDPLDRAYSLEIFSPGLDRPFTRMEDFTRYQGKDVRVKTDIAYEGRKRFRGTLTRVDEEEIFVAVEEGDVPIAIRKEHINQANLCSD